MIIGIDIGVKGGIGVLSNEGTFLMAYDLPNPYEVSDFISKVIAHDARSIGLDVFIEHPIVTHVQGRSGILHKGIAYGILLKSLDFYTDNMFEVHPAKWKSSFNLSKDKKKSIELCEILFPESKQYIHGKNGGIKDGVAEAILIAEYGRLMMTRQIDLKIFREHNKINKG